MKSTKITMKEKVLQYVESRGSATFTQIQRFIVDTKFGEGTYNQGHELEDAYVFSKKTYKYERQPVMKNRYRGYYCAAFSVGYRYADGTYNPNGYFLRGSDRLVKNGKQYSVVRGK